MTAASPARTYRFGAAVLEPAQRRLVVAGAVVPVPGRAFDLLAVLVERAGSLVSKDEIFDRVWPGLVVEENNLQVHISALRKILGGDAIATVPGRGYRFAAAVEVTEGDEAARGVRTNLPNPVTRFVGARDRIDQCARLLRDTRLLTVTGGGGLGKTRLSIETAHACLGRYADGVWMVELAPIADPTLVPQAVALAVGVAEQAGERVQAAIQKFITDRKVLLILDNCEHVLRSCAEVAWSLLRHCAQLTIIATSREPLHVQGESVYPLSALSFPDAAGPLTVEAMLAHDAVRLFVERATSAQPAFRLTDGNAPAVREICARLDGIPLALELAAARVRSLAVEAIAERLNDRFRLLTSRDTTVPSRQQTLRSTIDWSYDLLDQSEKALLRRLAVFVGGWTLPAAEVVGVGGALAAEDVLDVHDRLVDKSLVTVDVAGGRYTFLDTVRQYALERLEASGESDALRTRHLDFHARLADEAEPRLIGPEEDGWIARLDAERQNLHAAYLWSRRSGGAGQALRIVYGTRRWLCRGAFDLGRPLLGQELGAEHLEDPVRCRGLVAAAFLDYYAGHYDDSSRRAEEAIALARATREHALAADATGLLGMAVLERDRAAAARKVTEALALARLANDRVIIADQLTWLGEVEATAGDLASAERLYEEALAAARALRSRVFEVSNLYNLGRVCLCRGARDRARSLLREAVALADEGGSTRHAAVFLAFGAALAGPGDALRAARFQGAANRCLDDMMMRLEPADRHAFGPLLDRARAGVDPARFGRAEADGFALRREDALAEMRTWLSGS